MDKNKIVLTLVTNLDHVWCDSCRNYKLNQEKCNSCFGGGNSNWQISYEAAENITNKILMEN